MQMLLDLEQAAPGQVAHPSAAYLEEPRGKWQGQGVCVVTPTSTAQVSAIVQVATLHNNTPIVPYGGGTGLVGGQIKPGGSAPIILSLEKMNSIRGIWPDENTISVDAGCILADVQAAASDRGRMFPLSLASEGSARIGGLLGANAGGVNVLRYGNARDLVLGLEAVLPDGNIWNGMKRLRKDNTGYDLRNLLIGSEGTLGVITGAVLKLFPVPAAQGTALMVVENPTAALDLLNMARAQLGDNISAFELISGQGLQFLRQTMPQVRLPFDSDPDWMVLIDLGMAAGLDPETALTTLFETGLEAGLVHDGLIAQSQGQRQDFWTVREHIPEANRVIGALASHDVSLPLSEVARFIEQGQTALSALGDIRVNCFGHLGDGNLHFNVFPAAGRTAADMRKADPDLVACMTRTVHDLVHDTGGSVSAEHGIGRLKVDDLALYGDPTKLAAMRAIKDALDPNGIMNPGVMFAG